ncbi:hypothetical protein CA85_41630 [Allorhodopirellula solitaria]|uniref:Uncharacterized protein n=1 Tax=Allorhodopirellula solitaria TaxID=2527987 RepID=A0A5C5X1Y6_9BACT|nr:hypothetical protein CA85_41630 [Allorhodopirellula solitaria]
MSWGTITSTSTAMLSTSTKESQNQAVHLRTACAIIPMENQSSVLGDGDRSGTK